MSNEMYSRAIYVLFKDEVKREDDIVHQRSMNSLTFQGFLFASATFLISNPWFDHADWSLREFRRFFLVLQGATGFLVGLATTLGLLAARSSINHVSHEFRILEDKDDFLKDSRWPQLHGTKRQYDVGSFFASGVHFVLSMLWCVYLGSLIYFLFNRSGFAATSITALMMLCLFIIDGLAIFALRLRAEKPQPETDTASSDPSRASALLKWLRK